MKQAGLGLNPATKRTSEREFLDEMNRVVPWTELVALVSPFAPVGKKGRPPFAVATMLRIHFMQQWFGLSDPTMEESLHEVPLYREFTGLDSWTTRLPDESPILRFRHLLEKHRLAAQMLVVINDMLATKGPVLRAGMVVDATLIAAPSRTGVAMLEALESESAHAANIPFICAFVDDSCQPLVRVTPSTSTDFSMLCRERLLDVSAAARLSPVYRLAGLQTLTDVTEDGRVQGIHASIETMRVSRLAAQRHRKTGFIRARARGQHRHGVRLRRVIRIDQMNLPAPPRLNPKKLLLSKWTAVTLANREKHLVVVKVIEPEPPRLLIEYVELEAVHCATQYGHALEGSHRRRNVATRLDLRTWAEVEIKILPLS